MSKVLKKVVKGVKKVFKKIIKTVKKVLKSKIFKVIVAAVAIYFTAGAAAGWLGGASTTTAGVGATGVGAASTTAGTVAGTAGTAGAASGGIAVGSANSAWGAAMAGQTGAAASSVAANTAAMGGTLQAGSTSLLAKVGAWAGKHELLTATALTTGGNMLSGYAQAKEAEEQEKKERRRIERNSSTYLDVYGATRRSLELAGIYDSAPEDEYASMKKARNVDEKPAHFYNNATNKWQPVQAKAPTLQSPMARVSAMSKQSAAKEQYA